MHVGPNQKLFISSSDLYLPVNIYVYEHGQISLPDKTKLYNTRAQIEGQFGGVKEELILAYAELTFTDTAHTVQKDRGALELTKITVMNEGVLNFLHEVDYHLKLDKLVINTGGVVNARVLHLETGEVELQEGSLIDLDGRGEVKDGPGYSGAVSGAGHGGQGGVGGSEEEGVERGETNDEFLNPVLMGSGGETTRGGGALMVTAETVVMDGIIRAK